MEKITTSFFYTLYNLSNIDKSNSVLEVGCGTGLSILHVISFKNENL